MITFLIYLPFLLFFVVVAVYGERKISAFVQTRLGPMEVGPKGIFQTIADLLKMLQKEDIRPFAVDKFLFLSAPLIVFSAVFTGFSVLPFTQGIAGSAIDTGVFFLLGVISLDVLGILMAGWGSNNKFSVLGAIRSVAQIVSYEIPLGLSVLAVVMLSGTLNLQEISYLQSAQEETMLFGIPGVDIAGVGGFLAWNIFQMPILLIAFFVFFISSLAEANRVPFDLPESESELIGGYHTEYAGFRWGLFMLAEYGMMLLTSFLGAILFFGSWQSPLPNIGAVQLSEWTNGSIWGVFWLVSKTMLFILLQMMVRWTYPRLRVDQLMTLSWKYLTPISILVVFIVGLWKLALL